MTVHYSAHGCALDKLVCGTWKLRVNGDQINVLDYFWLDQRTTPTANPSDLGFLTVDGLFHEIDSILSDGPFSTDGFPVDYTIQFDPVLGYPTEIKRNGRQGRNAPVSTEVYHLGMYKGIQGLKIIKTK
ncbi:MAG: hypothetical protein ACJ78Q_08195 [Chloroflexia bacterium]